MSVSLLPRDVLKLILFSLEPFDMFCSVSGVCKKFWEISQDETYWEREYEEICSERLKETLDRVELSYRTLFLFFILNNPLRVLYKAEISKNIRNECKKLVEYMIRSSRNFEKDEIGFWYGCDVFQINDVHYCIVKNYANELALVRGYSYEYNEDILINFEFKEFHRRNIKSKKTLSPDIARILFLILLIFIIYVIK